MVITFGTRFDINNKFKNAIGDYAVDMVAPSSDLNPGLIGIYLRRGTSDFKVGQNITYEKDDLVISGEIKRIDDMIGQSFLVYNIPYSGNDINAPITGGFVYISPANSSPELPAAGTAKSGLADNITALAKKAKDYAPYIIIGVVIIGALIYKRYNNKK